jgi:beta-galactosidase
MEHYGALDGEYITPNYVADASGSIVSWKLSDLNNKPDGRLGYVFVDHTNIPNWAKSRYEGLTAISHNFTKYDIDHPGARELYGFLFGGTVPKMAGKNYTKLGYMLANEPSFFSQEGVWNTSEVSEYTKEKFRNWLQEKHDSIEVLNSLWGTGFESFDSVKISIPISASHEGTPMWYDWLLFNYHRVTEYFRFMKREIRKYDPDAMVHIKLMPWLWTGDKMDHGIDFEALTRMSDISGADAQAFNSQMWGDPGDWPAKYAFEWKEIAMAYDFFRSVRPGHIIFDTENHFLSTTRFRDLYLKADYARATYWLAFMHGLNAGRSWYWGREASGEPHGDVKWYPGTYLQQPQILNEMHEALIDLNNHSEEMTAIQQQPKPLRIYYSLSNAINRSSYMKDVFTCYELVNFEGVPLGFATDSILMESKPGDFEAVLVYKSERGTLQEFNALQAYLDSGGTVIKDYNSFKLDEYGRPHESLSPSNGTLISTSSILVMKREALELLEEKALLPEIVVTESNAIGPDACFWRCVKNKEGNNVVSLINLGKTNARLNFDLPGAPYGTLCRDLINGIEVPPDTVLRPCGVLFLEVTAREEPSDTTGVFHPTAPDPIRANLYPNPSPGSFRLEFSKSHEEINLQVFDLRGLNIYTQRYTRTDLISHDLTGHPDGIYLVRVRTDKGSGNFIFAKHAPE